MAKLCLELREREKLHALRNCFLCSQGYHLLSSSQNSGLLYRKNYKGNTWLERWMREASPKRTTVMGLYSLLSSALWRCVECCASFCHQFLKLEAYATLNAFNGLTFFLNHLPLYSWVNISSYNMDTLLPSLWLMSTMIFLFSRTLCNKLIA